MVLQRCSYWRVGVVQALALHKVFVKGFVKVFVKVFVLARWGGAGACSPQGVCKEFRKSVRKSDCKGVRKDDRTAGIYMYVFTYPFV